jgi:trehalose-6-phosphate synthase
LPFALLVAHSSHSSHSFAHALQFEGKKILMGRDRLDTIKGIPQKLLAFEDFLGRFPEWRGKAVLFQVCLPPREERKTNKSHTSSEGELQELHAQINEYAPPTNILHIVIYY